MKQGCYNKTHDDSLKIFYFCLIFAIKTRLKSSKNKRLKTFLLSFSQQNLKRCKNKLLK